MKKSRLNNAIIAPVSGKVVSLDKVADEVFSGRILGDGVAVMPTSGDVVSPVDGTVTSIPNSKHAYCFLSDGGLSVLVHFGLETVSLKGEGFEVFVSEGEKVSVGQLVARVDIDYLKSNEIDTITPVLICDTDKNYKFELGSEAVEAGKDILYKVS